MSTLTTNQPARLTAIELENFKGVGEGVRLDLKPITLLFGANSAGKSTILQALQYAREVLERRNTNPDRTLYGGDFVDLGGFHNLVHQRDLSRRIGITLELTLNGMGLPELVPEAFEDWAAPDDEVWEFYELLSGIKARIETIGVRFAVGWNANRNCAVITAYEVLANGERLAIIEATQDGRDAAISVNPKNPIFHRPMTPEELQAQVLLVDLGSQDEEAESATQKPAKHEPISTINEYLQATWALEDAGIDGAANGFREWLSGADGALPHLQPLLYTPSGKSKGKSALFIAREFTSFLTAILIGPAVLVRDQLRAMRYLGPIRNVPAREFQPALTPNEAHWADGVAAWESLLTGSDELVKSTSEWFSATDKLNTGYEIDRRWERAIDEGLLNWVASSDDTSGARLRPDVLAELDRSPRKMRLELIETRTGLRVQSRDVGIGISQVLPVVVAALDPTATLVAIEQPELHIHPAVQVGLGDLFARAAADNGSVFLIETHSEHLILRLLRRIRETNDGELPPSVLALRPDQVGVIYVERCEAGVKLTALAIDRTGEFTSRWPVGFFEERAGELF